MSISPLDLEYGHKNLVRWDHKINLPGTAPHSLISEIGLDSDNRICDYWTVGGDLPDESQLTVENGKAKFTSTAGTNQCTVIALGGNPVGPCWFAYAIVDEWFHDIGTNNAVDVFVQVIPSLRISAQVRGDVTNTVKINIDGASAGADAGDHVTTAFAPPGEPFSIALNCNHNSVCVMAGDRNARNWRRVSPWYSMTEVNLAADAFIGGYNAGDAVGGKLGFRCVSTTSGATFEISKCELRYFDGIGTRETYLINDLDGSPIKENGRVWMTTDRTLMYDEGLGTHLANGAQCIVCQFDPRTGHLGEETARYFYKINGETFVAQNMHVVWDTAQDVYHVYIPDWGQPDRVGDMGWCGMLYQRIEGIDIKYGVHVFEPVELNLPTSEHFTPDYSTTSGDYVFDPSMVVRPDGTHVLLLSWVDQSRGFPAHYTRVLFTGDAPDNFTAVSGWDDGHYGEGHRLVIIDDKLHAVSGGAPDTGTLHFWAIEPGENWLSYIGAKQPFLGPHGQVPGYPFQPEIFSLRQINGKTVYFTTLFAMGLFESTNPASTGSFMAFRSQAFDLP